ncbi:recombinase family protein [Calothrix sp. UHCC 0171]|uniref:recombinase family protein n=1 Tax=Calothrix sp. UHCC 0171 TaxID=3110245 RepID=UPI002B1FD48C|nr:recombinase family protein [Calothrix sp. UHCC 0171]MEA5572494.1 recombinase family protein [Calothrix sp. UHCC 0171]
MTADNSHNGSIWERLERGRKLKAARGGYAGYGSPPYGLTSINGELVENPDEQAIIEMIRRHHKSGKSLQQIANWLNENDYTTKRGQMWKRISVKRVLDRLYGKTPRISGVTTSSNSNYIENRNTHHQRIQLEENS